MQVNRYSTIQEYMDDTSRSSSKSAVSLIAESSAAVYDGVNCLTHDIRSGGVGDLVVYDKAMSMPGLVKGDTLHALSLPDNLVPVGVVFWNGPDRLLFASLKDMTWNGSKNMMWGHLYEAAISGLTLSAGGTLSVTVSYNGKEETASVQYAAGSTLAGVATQLSTEFSKLADSVNRSWRASADADGGRIILYTSSISMASLVSVTGADLTAVDTFHPLAEYAYLTATESVRRNNRVLTNFAGASLEKFIDNYSQNGTVPSSNVPLGSTTIVRRDAFGTSAYCSDLRAAYATYEDYLVGEHFLQYPTGVGAGTRDGRKTTALLASRVGTAVRGADEPLYPPAWACATYGVSVEGHVTGFESGNWWLPSATEMMLLMRDRAISAASIENDPVNRTLAQMSGDGIYGNQSRWTCCEYFQSLAFYFYGFGGSVGTVVKSDTFAVRALSALKKEF